MSEESEIGSDTSKVSIHGLNIIIPNTSETVSYFNQSLREIVSIHEDAFKKLLFEKVDIPLELAELFEHVGNRYLDFSIEISAAHNEYQSRLNSTLNPLE